LLSILDKSRSELAAEDERVRELQDAWQPERQDVIDEYNELLKSIGGDREAKERERQRLTQQLERQKSEAKGYRQQIADLDNLRQAREDLLDRLEQAACRQFELRKTKYDQITELSGGKLRVNLKHMGDRSAFEAALMELLKGGANAPPVAERRAIAEAVLPRCFVQLIMARDAAKLAEDAGLTSLWAERVIEKLWSHDDFAEILALPYMCYPGDVPDIRFRKEGGEYAELTELSVGQKSTALLIIALCDGDMPVVIDQPEDALDIISVWEDIAKQLRRGKDKRQFILTTHNSSVAVAADSDQFIVMKAGARSGRVVAAGAIDRPEVRKEVITHLEGGDEPYKLRSLKYNLS
jgi:hypothetical protein